MRILLAIHGFPPTHYAGAERAGERIVKWLIKHGHEVEVMAVEQVNAEHFRVETSTQDGYVIHRLFYNLNENGQEFRNGYDYPRIGDALRDILRQKPFDLLHMISGYLIGAPVIHTAREMGVPVAVTLTEYWYLCTRLNLIQPTGAICSGPESDFKCARCLLEEKRRFRLPAQIAPDLNNAFWSISENAGFAQDKTEMVRHRRNTLRDALNAADLVISPSRFLIQMYHQYGFDTSRYVFIRHGLDMSSAMPHIPDDTLRIGYLGQVKFHKGVDVLVDAAVSMLKAGHKITLDIWGPLDEDPGYTRKLQQQSAGHPQINWRGRYQSDKLWDILASFDVLVVPSRWYENCPTVILEAYSVKLPVIATNLGGMAELVAHEQSGLVFEPDSSADLSRQLERLISEPGLIDRFRLGIPHIKSADEEVSEIFAEYQKLVHRVP